MLPVNEVFETVQGEATWTGMPSVFVRLQVCDVGCPWCDTKHTWHLKPELEIAPAAMQHKLRDDATFARMDPPALLRMLRTSYGAKHVVLTGGEPCIYDLVPLTALLLDERYSVQVETSGTYPIRVDSRTWVTCSPKVGMPGKLKVRSDSLDRADEIKMPVGRKRDIVTLAALLDARRPRGGVWLQPLSCSEKATELCLRQATMYGWRVSLQMHKFAGLR